MPFSKFIDTESFKLFFIFNFALSPSNVNNCSGFVVPIPTLPPLTIRNLSVVELVIN